MSSPFSFHSFEPLERLQVKDGLRLTAERWRQAHHYHRQRQNIHYQSINQAGIVWGLEVLVIEAPANFASQYRDRRWVRILPGMAIDAQGNPIIVPQPIDYHIASEAPLMGDRTVYLVAQYVDPDTLNRPVSRDLVQETFRIDEKVQPADALEVELCRIHLRPGTVELSPAEDVFFPAPNTLDLRFRQQASLRPQEWVRVARHNGAEAVSSDQQAVSLNGLLRSLPGLYPMMQAAGGVEAIDINRLKAEESLLDYTLLVFPPDQLSSFQPGAIEALTQYLQAGGTVLLELDTDGTKLDELLGVRIEIRQAIATLRQDRGTANLQQELNLELQEIDQTIDEQLGRLTQPIRIWAGIQGIPLNGNGQLHAEHPLRTDPFLFGRLPKVMGFHSILLNWGGLVILVGKLSQGWALDPDLTLTRDEIRAAQEVGINLLHFAERRRRLTVVAATIAAAPTPTPTDTPPERRRSKDLFDKLDF